MTSSEDLLMDYLALSRLSGYRARIDFVNEMPVEDFSMLYEEYCDRSTCKLDFERFVDLVDCMSAWLPSGVAELDESGVRSWIDMHVTILHEVLQFTTNTLRLDARLVYCAIRRLMREDGSQRNPSSTGLRELTILYPVCFTGRFKPQLRIYAKLPCED